MKNMKKHPVLLATILCFGSLSLGLCSLSPLSAQADEASVSSENARLLVPGSKQEYLSLTSPSSVSHHGDAFVIADGARLYLYSPEKDGYETYEHGYNKDAQLNVITQALYATDGNVYFTDSTNAIYRFQPQSGQIERSAINCSVFALDGDTLYYSTVTGRTVTIAKTDLDFSTPETLKQFNGIASPALYASGGDLYYSDRNVLRSVKTGEGIETPLLDDDIFSFAFQGNLVYLVTVGEKLVVFDRSNRDEFTSFDGAYNYVEQFNGSVYAANGDKIERFGENGKKSLYEISASSSSPSRLSRANSLSYDGDALTVADESTGRVTLYSENGDYLSSFETESLPNRVCSDDDSILVESGSLALLYDRKGNLLSRFDELSGGEIYSSAVNVYGVYYLVTSANSFCKISPSASGDYAFEKVSKGLNAVSRHLTADVYGNIYLSLSDQSVYRFSEAEFMDATATGAYRYRFSSEIKSLCASYDGTLYALTDGAILSSGEERIPLERGGYVYGDSSAPVSIAIGYSSNTLYTLYPTYLTATEAIAVPNLSDVSLGDAASEIFRLESVPLTVVGVEKGAILSTFDLSSIESAENFPYTGTTRAEEEKQALLLGSTADYYILSLFDPETHRYTANFVAKSSCQALDSDLFLTKSEKFPDGTAYTSNAVELLKYPFYFKNLALSQLTRSQKVTVLGDVSLNNGEDFPYCYVSVEVDEQSLTGYIPASFLVRAKDTSGNMNYISTGYIYTAQKTIVMTAQDGKQKSFSTSLPFNVIGDPYQESEVTISYTDLDGTTYYTAVSSDLFKTNKQKNLRRYVVIVFGIIAVIIVTDYFILRKRKPREDLDDDEEYYE